MEKKTITGIQQVGVGVENVQEAFAWYRRHFGMDIKVFEEAAVAELMLHYTEGKKRERHAVLAYNMQGGGGFEVWQHTGKTPKKPDFDPQLGDIGIFIAKLKSKDAQRAWELHQEMGVEVLGEVEKDPSGRKHYFVRDPYNNIFQIVEEGNQFEPSESPNGGVYGAIVGVTDISKSLKIYQDILEYDQVVYDKVEVFKDFNGLPNGTTKVRRICLRHLKPRTGGFSPLLGPTEIELVQLVEGKGRNIFENRIWGDPGFIHLCFDVIGMDKVKAECEKKGYPFTVDSSESFDMGEAAGHFSYISDPDGIPIEFVETHKVPILKKIGWYMNLKGRDPLKALPTWMIKTMRWKRVK